MRYYIKFSLIAYVFETPEPSTFKEEVKDQTWKPTMDEELNSILKNDTWELTKLPPGKKAIDYRWLYKIKFYVDGTVEHQKAHLVIRGFKQQERIDYDETFALIANMATFHLVMSLEAQFGWPVYQMDVKSAFLNGELKEEVFLK